jgi:hypothetical protein
MITVDEFRSKLRCEPIESIVDSVLLAPGAVHVSGDNIDQIANTVGAKFGVHRSEIDVRIVGSAKIGFSLTEKRLRDGTVLPRYRAFSPTSDIDVAILSTEIFDLIWDELSSYAHRALRLPWDSGPLGDYLICGWLRPDYFPIRARLRLCDDWWDAFRSLSADSRFGRRKVRGGLFHSLDHMKRYQMRALAECSHREGLDS